jgi:hypothetical protein
MVLAGQAFITEYAKTTTKAIYQDKCTIVVARSTLAHAVLCHIVCQRSLHVGYLGVSLRQTQGKYIIDRLSLKPNNVKAFFIVEC